ncbi:MAG: hypothetical protein A3H97_04240 [Acidobacteria bacterium RIFCSPLOWO2_02_FULL_65_29]|nr:MAG: hypothetical protein A3H97_04240 [Acidobacteria bacterium RIFCSPLOWO2_02_FULL_65_29]
MIMREAEVVVARAAAQVTGVDARAVLAEVVQEPRAREAVVEPGVALRDGLVEGRLQRGQDLVGHRGDGQVGEVGGDAALERGLRIQPPPSVFEQRALIFPRGNISRD